MILQIIRIIFQTHLKESYLSILNFLFGFNHFWTKKILNLHQQILYKCCVASHTFTVFSDKLNVTWINLVKKKQF